jgi:hypothetical protein
VSVPSSGDVLTTRFGLLRVAAHPATVDCASLGSAEHALLLQFGQQLLSLPLWAAGLARDLRHRRGLAGYRDVPDRRALVRQAQYFHP